MKKIVLTLLLAFVGIQASVPLAPFVDPKKLDAHAREEIKKNTRRNGTNKIIQTRPLKSALKNGATQGDKKSVRFSQAPMRTIDTSYDDDDFETQMQQIQQPSLPRLLWHFINQHKWKIGSSILGLFLLGYLYKKMRSK